MEHTEHKNQQTTKEHKTHETRFIRQDEKIIYEHKMTIDKNHKTIKHTHENAQKITHILFLYSYRLEEYDVSACRVIITSQLGTRRWSFTPHIAATIVQNSII